MGAIFSFRRGANLQADRAIAGSARRCRARAGLVLGVVGGGLVVTAAVPALAVDKTTPQVAIESRFVEAHADFLAGIGVNFDSATGGYSSTGGQQPFSGSSTQADGAIGVGARLFVTTGLGRTQPQGPLGVGPVSVGGGVSYMHLFGGDNDILGISRHHGGNDVADVFGSRNINSFTDVVVAAKVPLVFRPRVVSADGQQATIVLVPEIGVTFADTETTIRSDQTFFGGNDSTTRRSETETGAVLGLGVETKLGEVEIPSLGKIPVLGGLFYHARHVPGSDVSQRSSLGFTETVHTDSTWDHQLLIVFITPLIISDRAE